ncbi:unnamed protein product (macronuclear) [Paramecium tetraurelia]|uniref:Uncharacterized protein n=1 Tax=Paramecium tetraurelia TaxID=5888 RepID=A0C107_PARTE|nr:uncharacterized protein GSPATT00033950001 [Paramecium tetraurelia]CAK64474.1 unnamed protein product [Paramecium tetraurelia]|eukprot:XP_001431872.1 hypothetical protein (macronuclear) [Paramecium tetraurelia strain d4-2]
MFCLCGSKQENKEQEHAQSTNRTTLQSKMRLNNSASPNSISIAQDCNRVSQEYTDFLCEYEKSQQEKSYFFDEYECSPYQKLEESKTDYEESMLMHQGDGLLVKSIKVNQQSIAKLKDTFTAFIMRILYDIKSFFDITPLQEVKFVKSLVPNILTELTYRRVKNDKLLIAHDPTGSFLLKHLSSSQQIYFIEETQVFRPILEKGIEVLNCQNKLHFIAKSNITAKLDTAIVNLLFLHDIPIYSVIWEYLDLAHDLILILSPKLEYHEMISQLRQGIKNSAQSHIYCSVEIQSVYEYNKLIAFIVYYGDISEIKQNQQLHFLYKCISKTVQKTFKYKEFLKNLRSQIGVMKLVDLFSLYGLLFDSSDENFKRFYKQVKKEYFPTIKSQKFIQVDSIKSSTESESEGIQEISSVNSLETEFKSYSKSVSIHKSNYVYVHFHSQNSQKSTQQEEQIQISQ